MRLAIHSCVSRLCTAFVLFGLALIAQSRAAAASPPGDPLWQAELRAGYGIALGGAELEMSRRPTPVTVTAAVAIAINDTPRLFGYGGAVVETLDRSGAGAVAGVELQPRDGRRHLAGGGIAMLAPYTLYGATASAGLCMKPGWTVRLCGDLQMIAFFAGDDLGAGRTVTEFQFAVGVVFDGL
jgi:hypothetical protein